MFTRVTEMMQAKIDALRAGDLVQAVSYCDFPMQVRMSGRDVQFVRPAEMIAFLEQIQAQHLAAGITASTAQIGSVELPRRGLFRVWVCWRHQDTTGAEVGHSDMIYHCRESRKRLRVEAAEVVKFSLPGLAEIPVPRRQIV